MARHVETKSEYVSRQAVDRDIAKSVRAHLVKVKSPMDIKKEFEIKPGDSDRLRKTVLKARIKALVEQEKKLESALALIEKQVDLFDLAINRQMEALKIIEEDDDADNFIENRQAAREAEKAANLARCAESSSQAPNCAILRHRNGTI